MGVDSRRLLLIDDSEIALAYAESVLTDAGFEVRAVGSLRTFQTVLASWRRAGFIGGLLVGLYAVLYILLSLEAYSLLIGSLLLFAALAGVMYATRRIDWGAPRTIPAAS